MAAGGLFIAGTDTGVGKTYVAALIARALVQAGKSVGVYKPVASGCRREGNDLVSDDAVALWEAAGRPGEFDRVCPQRFAAALAPHLAARAEGRQVDAALLRSGLDYWRQRSEIVLVEGSGGLLSPVSDDEYVADLAADFGYPLVVVARNALGTINQTLQTLVAAATFRDGLDVAGVVMNDATADPDDISRQSNLAELRARCVPPLLGRVLFQSVASDRNVDWIGLAGIAG
jgi:dethiobiotin synthetase